MQLSIQLIRKHRVECARLQRTLAKLIMNHVEQKINESALSAFGDYSGLAVVSSSSADVAREK